MEQPPARNEVPIWARPGRERRPTLTRQAVVAAAMRIADADGLSAVSIRRVAAALGARSMSLYSHIDSKDDLLDLMREQVAAETFVEGELPTDWREALRVIARREREIGLRHPWMIHLIGHAGQVGPSALRHLEQALRALSGLTTDPIAGLRICVAVDEYVLGHVIGVVTRRPTGSFSHPYTRMLLDSGAFPTLLPLVTGGLPRLGDTFEHGLTCLLNGIEATHRR